MKKFFCIILALSLMLCFSACDSIENTLETLVLTANAKTFTVDNLSIELSRDFMRMDILVPDTDFCISSDDVVIAGWRIDYDENELEDISARDYAAAFREAMDEPTMTEIADLNGIPTMQYQSINADDETQTVFIAVYESSQCLWLLEFIFDLEDYDELYPTVEQYALSVTCE